jgi:hypothetical protein
MPRVHVPPVIVVFLLVDAALAVAYLADYLCGQPYRPLSVFLDLGRENNLPTWYASVQWFFIAVLLGLFALRNLTIARPRSWALALLPLVCLALSLDEVSEIHEWLGKMSDGLLAGGRAGSALPQTGIWIFLLGIPFVLLMGSLLVAVRAYFGRAPDALRKIVLGLAVMLAGAIGVEVLSNLVVPDSLAAALQVLSEESLEMLGATIVLWGAFEVLERHGLVFDLEAVDTSRVETPSWPARSTVGSRLDLERPRDRGSERREGWPRVAR